MVFPPLRYVQATPVEHEGQRLVVLNDPEGIMSDTLAVPMPLYFIMTLIDGRRDAQGLQQEVAKASGGQMIPTEEIERIVQELDSHYLLENERAAQRREELMREFDLLQTRPAVHAGKAYPDDPEECSRMFAEMFDGLLDGAGARGRPRGLVLPHIDMRVGGRCLAKGLVTLDPQMPPDLYIILGVAHGFSKNLFTLTDKSFETPLGLAETDQAAAGRLRELYGADRLDGQIVHKLEHSVEFQAVSLRYHHREAPGFKILPILCGSLHEIMEDGSLTPREVPEVGEFIEAMRRLIDEHEGNVCIIASVDLSHVGLKFGDPEGVNENRARDVRSADQRMLDQIATRDAEGFFNHFRADANARNVDAVTSVYVLMHTLGTEGVAEQIDYEQWKEEPTDSIVTYASVAIY